MYVEIKETRALEVDLANGNAWLHEHGVQGGGGTNGSAWPHGGNGEDVGVAIV